MAATLEQIIEDHLTEMDTTKEAQAVSLHEWRKMAPIKRNETMQTMRRRIVAHWLNRPDTGEHVEIHLSPGMLSISIDGVEVFRG